MKRMDELRGMQWSVLRRAYLTALTGYGYQTMSVDRQNAILAPHIGRMVEQANMLDECLIQAAAEGQAIVFDEMEKSQTVRETERATARARIQELGPKAPEREERWWQKLTRGSSA